MINLSYFFVVKESATTSLEVASGIQNTRGGALNFFVPLLFSLPFADFYIFPHFVFGI